MPVLVEGISVVVRRDAISVRYPGGWENFVKNVPNRTLCADADLARVGFMTPDDVKDFVAALERLGLRFKFDGKAIDLAVVDQVRGPTCQCEWLAFGHGDVAPGQRVAGAALVGSSEKKLITPDGWNYERSLSAQFTFVPTGEEAKRLKYLRTEKGLDVFLDLVTGKEVYVGRTSK